MISPGSHTRKHGWLNTEGSITFCCRISLAGLSAYQGPVSILSPTSITGRQSARHNVGQAIAGAGLLSGWSLFPPPEPPSRAERKAERPRPLPRVRLKQGQFRPLRATLGKSRRTVCCYLHPGLVERLVPIPDLFARVSLIDRGLRRHLRCRDPRGFISDDFAMETACLASPESDSTADAKLGYSFDAAVLLSPSARERLRPDLKAIVHAHPEELVAFSHCRRVPHPLAPAVEPSRGPWSSPHENDVPIGDGKPVEKAAGSAEPGPAPR
jgi:hypothetical protein